MKTIHLIYLAIIFFTLQSCSDDDSPEYIHDHEAIEELVVTVTNINTDESRTYTFENGSVLGPEIILNLQDNYNFKITELNAHHGDEDENILPEVIAEKDEHFFLYSRTNTLILNLQRIDIPENVRTDGNQLGINLLLTPIEASSGNFQIELKHQATAVDGTANEGWGSATGGATDLTATFPIVIQ